MTEKAARGSRPRGRLLPRLAWLIGLVAAVALVAALLADVAVRHALRERVAVLDGEMTGGLLRGLLRGELFPGSLPPVAPAPPGAYDWLGEEPFLPIAHALGPSLRDGPNTLPTLAHGLELDFRVFEVDLTLTADGHLVCYHGGDGEELNRLTFAAYLDWVRRKGFSPCEFADLLAVARERPAIHFVLDVKNRFDDAYGIMRRSVAGTGFGRAFIPQVYYFSQLAGLRRSPVFAGEIFTSYRSGLSTGRIFELAHRFGVRVVTLTPARVREAHGHLPADLAVFTHPVDDPFLAEQLRQWGLRGIYTSYFTPRTIPQLFQR